MPLFVQTMDGVAMSVGQNGRPVRPLQPFRHQNGAEAGLWVGVNLDRKAHAQQPRLNCIIQIALHIGGVSGVLGGAGDGHQGRQMVAESAPVEKGQCACDRAIPR